MRIRDTRSVGGHDVLIINLAGNPPLHKSHVLVGRELDGLTTAVQPREGMISGPVVSIKGAWTGTLVTHAPADMRGQLVWLQMEVPSSSFS